MKPWRGNSEKWAERDLTIRIDKKSFHIEASLLSKLWIYKGNELQCGCVVQDKVIRVCKLEVNSSSAQPSGMWYQCHF